MVNRAVRESMALAAAIEAANQPLVDFAALTQQLDDMSWMTSALQDTTALAQFVAAVEQPLLDLDIDLESLLKRMNSDYPSHEANNHPDRELRSSALGVLAAIAFLALAAVVTLSAGASAARALLEESMKSCVFALRLLGSLGEIDRAIPGALLFWAFIQTSTADGASHDRRISD